jgi:hypothetical protein
MKILPLAPKETRDLAHPFRVRLLQLLNPVARVLPFLATLSSVCRCLTLLPDLGVHGGYRGSICFMECLEMCVQCDEAG